MDSLHLNELAELEESYWWHVAKRELVAALLMRHVPPPARLVEAGTGAGGNLAVFEKLGYQVAGLDISDEAVCRCHERGLRSVFQHDAVKSWPLEEKSVDVAVLLDVIEHCADAVAVLRNAQTVLRPGGLAIISVPALAWLYGPWDEALGHYRRYSKKQIRSEAAQAGLQELWLSYWNAFSLPPAIVVRTKQKYFGRNRPPKFPRIPGFLNQFLIQAARTEQGVLRRWGLPVGLSLAGVFQNMSHDTTW